MLFLKDLEFYT